MTSRTSARSIEPRLRGVFLSPKDTAFSLFHLGAWHQNHTVCVTCLPKRTPVPNMGSLSEDTAFSFFYLGAWEQFQSNAHLSPEENTCALHGFSFRGSRFFRLLLGETNGSFPLTKSKE